MKLKIVDPARSLVAKLLAKTPPRNPFFTSKGRPSNDPYFVSGLLKGEKVPPEKLRPKEDYSLEERKHNHFVGMRQAANADPKTGKFRKMPNSKPKKPGRSPEGVKAVKDHREIQELARLHGPKAIEAMAEILKSKMASDLAKISASNALLDRGYGKAPQPHDGDGQGGVIHVVVQTGVPRREITDERD